MDTWSILWSFVIFYGHLVHFTVFCYILWTFGIVRGNLVYFFPVLVFCTKKNLATLLGLASVALIKPWVEVDFLQQMAILDDTALLVALQGPVLKKYFIPELAKLDLS
jgi:hypothetical protein